jgi:hypothetical protein
MVFYDGKGHVIWREIKIKIFSSLYNINWPCIATNSLFKNNDFIHKAENRMHKILANKFSFFYWVKIFAAVLTQEQLFSVLPKFKSGYFHKDINMILWGWHFYFYQPFSFLRDISKKKLSFFSYSTHAAFITVYCVIVIIRHGITNISW